MKKLLLLVAVTVASMAFASTASAQTWGLGARLGSGFQAVGQYEFGDQNYLEARLGLDYVQNGVVGADFSLTYNWHCFDWKWTPGNWFFDAGVGLFVGGGQNYARIGAMGVAKLGYTFPGVPLSLGFDWSPSVGPAIGYAKGFSYTNYDQWQLCNFGISAVYKF